MGNNEKETIKKVIDVLGKAVAILTLQLEDIAEIGRLEGLTDENEENKRSIILVTKRNSLELFRDTLNFLIYRLKNEKKEFFIFYLPQVRVLIEIYSYHQYLSTLHEDDQLILILTNSLYTMSCAARGSKEVDPEIQGLYSQQKNTFQFWLDEYQINIPERVDGLTKKKMKKQNLIIVPVEQRLNAHEIIENCPLSSELWKEIPKSIYEFYRKFSLYVHGDPLMTKARGNEVFWIISECLIQSSLIIELVNSKIINNRRVDEHKSFIDMMKKELPGFVELWSKKHKINNSV